MEDRGNVTTPDPSFDLSWPVVADKLNTGTYKGVFRFPGQEKTVFDRTTLPWKQAYCDVLVSGADVMKARGPYAAFQLTDGLKQAARMSIADEMGKQIYSDGTGTDFDGIVIGADDGVLYPTYAGIARSSLVGWRAYVNGASVPFTLPYLTKALGKA